MLLQSKKKKKKGSLWHILDLFYKVKISVATIVEANHVCLFRLTNTLIGNYIELGLKKIKTEELKIQGHLTFFPVDLLLVKIVMFY